MDYIGCRTSEKKRDMARWYKPLDLDFWQVGVPLVTERRGDIGSAVEKKQSERGTRLATDAKRGKHHHSPVIQKIKCLLQKRYGLVLSMYDTAFNNILTLIIWWYARKSNKIPPRAARTYYSKSDIFMKILTNFFTDVCKTVYLSIMRRPAVWHTHTQSVSIIRRSVNSSPTAYCNQSKTHQPTNWLEEYHWQKYLKTVTSNC